MNPLDYQDLGLSYKNPGAYLAANESENSILFYSKKELEKRVSTYLQSFPGVTSYSVKANPLVFLLKDLFDMGVRSFDVASLSEIELLNKVSQSLELNYNNPIRSCYEVKNSIGKGVFSYSVDNSNGLKKLLDYLPASATEISVRYQSNTEGAKYNFNSKFGASFDNAVHLLSELKKSKFLPSLSFHLGTQCMAPQAWSKKIEIAANIATKSNTRLNRLNVGGGFPSHREITQPNILSIFKAITQAVERCFKGSCPQLICEPGRGLVADAFCLAVKVKEVGDDKSIFINDGLYGALFEFSLVGNVDRIEILTENQSLLDDPWIERSVFGPTCDSIDKLPGKVRLPENLAEGDVIIFHGMGAYSTSVQSTFNGFEYTKIVKVESLYSGGLAEVHF